MRTWTSFQKIELFRVWRTIRFAAAVALATAIVLIWPEWWKILPRAFRRNAIDRFLLASLLVYQVGLVSSLVVAVVLAAAFPRWKERGRRARRIAWKTAALIGSFCLGAIVLEAGSAAWLHGRNLWTGVVAKLPKHLDRGDLKTIRLAVIGGSSARGYPYQDRLSIGEIVAWKLREALPDRKVEVDVLAEPGATLETMCGKLARIKNRPDVLIVYSGQNEFQARFLWDRTLCDNLGSGPSALSASPFCRLVLEARERNAIDAIPKTVARRQLVDRPVCRDWEYQEILANFRRSLESIVVECESRGILPILVVPPSNDAGFEPSRSVLPASATLEERREVERLFKLATAGEADPDPNGSLAFYQTIRERYPGFAEARYRTARLLRRAGRLEEAAREYAVARDCDALPLRCPSPFLEVYRRIATRHDCPLVDGPSILRRLSASGFLDYHVFHDEHHPTLIGHAGLAEAVLAELRKRRAFGWSGGEPPKVDPQDCARRFRVDRETWRGVCEQSRVVHRFLAGYRYDPTERLAWASRFERARLELEAGGGVEELNVPGLTVRSPKLPR